jgi:succinylglutamate desuccinylase
MSSFPFEQPCIRWHLELHAAVRRLLVLEIGVSVSSTEMADLPMFTGGAQDL